MVLWVNLAEKEDGDQWVSQVSRVYQVPWDLQDLKGQRELLEHQDSKELLEQEDQGVTLGQTGQLVKWVHRVYQERLDLRDFVAILEILVCQDLMEPLVKKEKLAHQDLKELKDHRVTWDLRAQLDQKEGKGREASLVREDQLVPKDLQAKRETRDLLAFLGTVESLVLKELLVK